MEGLLIEWRLRTPMALPSHPIHLDALLARAVFEDALRDARRINPSDGCHAAALKAAHENLPLARDYGVWMASQLEFVPAPSGGFWYEPQFRSIEWGDVAAAAASGRLRGVTRSTMAANPKRDAESVGRWRSYQFGVPAAWIVAARAWCIGIPSEVRRLVSSIAGIGKHTRNGMGEVASVSVTQSDLASINSRRRSLPAGSVMALPQHYPSYGCVSPPYWDRTKYAPILEYPCSILA